MKKSYSLEDLVISLFVLGFDKIDLKLISLILGHIVISQRDEERFEYVDRNLTKEFKMMVECEEDLCFLRKGVTMDGEFVLGNNIFSVREFFMRGRKELIYYLSTLNYEEILKAKVEQTHSSKPAYFCEKEKELLKSFGLVKNLEEINNEESLKK